MTVISRRRRAAAARPRAGRGGPARRRFVVCVFLLIPTYRRAMRGERALGCSLFRSGLGCSRALRWYIVYYTIGACLPRRAVWSGGGGVRARRRVAFATPLGLALGTWRHLFGRVSAQEVRYCRRLSPLAVRLRFRDDRRSAISASVSLAGLALPRWHCLASTPGSSCIRRSRLSSKGAAGGSRGRWRAGGSMRGTWHRGS